MEDASKNVQSFMVGDMLVFGGTLILTNTPYFNGLLTPDKCGNYTEVLEVLLATMFSKELFKEHLPGGT